MPRLIKILIAIGASLLVTATGATWWAYREIGKTPGELMDYAQRRLQGHEKLERIVLPAMALLRVWLDQPSRQELQQTPFVIPPLPKLVAMPAGPESDGQSSPPETAQRVLRVGPFENIRSIAQAAQLAKDNDIVEIQAGQYHGDVALWHQRKLTIRTRGGTARLFADGNSAEGKAIWVIRDGDFRIENIDFVGAHVSDHNGAGIRFEGGKLHLKNCLFYGNDNGLVTTATAGTLTIEGSEFAYNGFGDGFSHNLYVGRIDTLTITGSYFHHANVGHLLKSRARHNNIYYNRITDESGGRASYELDFPNGGIAYIVGNTIQQDVSPQNSTVISYGLEGLAWPENKLFLASNTIVNDQAYGGTFVHTAPGTQRFVSTNNLLIGKGKLHSGTVSAESSNNTQADWGLFEQASRYNYQLNAKGQLLHFEPPADPQLVPQSEYVSPRMIRKLNAPPSFPGAIQMR